MYDVLNALAALNQAASVGLAVLALLCVGHLGYRLRWTAEEERAMVRFFLMFVLCSVSDRLISAEFVARGLAGDASAVIAGTALIIARGALAVIAWTWALYVLIVVWGRR